MYVVDGNELAVELEHHDLVFCVVLSVFPVVYFYWCCSCGILAWYVEYLASGSESIFTLPLLP